MGNERGRITRREALVSLGALAAGGVILRGSALAQEASARPNVLFIAADDLNTRLGCYGHPFMKTPNLDRVATRGVRFDRAYCQFPLCNPSRSSLLTGRRPDTTKVLDNQKRFRDALPNAITMGQYFQQQGYWMARTGKIYHGGLAEDAGWDLKEDNPSVPPELAAKTRVAAEGGRLPPPGPVKKGKRTPAMYWRSIDGPDEAQRDGQLAVKAVEFIRKRPKGKPFFMAIGFWKPHAPYIAPSKYFDLYPVDSIQLPKVPRNDWADLPPEAYAGLTAWNQDISDEHAREFIRAYYACISFMDAQLGKALNALEEASVLEDTVIVFWGDNGYLLTEHGMWHKNRLFEEACRVPLIATAPGRKARGVGCSRLVEFVDIYPTLAELCGLPAPEGVEGTSFAPLMDDPSRPWKKAAFTQTATGRSVRTQRWRYTEWGGPEKAELYDHEAEPSEHTNLAKDPKCAATVKELHELLEKGWRAALP